MRVLVVTIVHVPSDARIHQRQIGALEAAADLEVTYAAPFSGYGVDPGAMDVRALDLPRARGRQRLTALRAARRLLKRESAHHDLVLLHDPELLLSAVGLTGRAAFVWDVHEDTEGALADRPWVPSWLRPVAAWLVRRSERWAERKMHVMLAEEGYRERFRNSHPVVPNVPRVPERVPPPDRDRVVYLGRISVLRGGRELLALAERVPELTVHVIGPVDPDLESAYREADRAGRIRWDGYLPNAEALTRLQGALAGLSLLHDHPNYRLSRPTKVLEYMAAGIPVIATPLPAVEEVLAAGDVGLLVPFGDVDAVVRAVRELRADNGRRVAMGREGHDVARERFDWNREGEQFVALLRSWAL